MLSIAQSFWSNCKNLSEILLLRHNSTVIKLFWIELERSQEVAMSLEEKSKQAERERNELTEAQKRAEEARYRAEQAANLEKEERERKVRLFTILLSIHYRC